MFSRDTRTRIGALAVVAALALTVAPRAGATAVQEADVDVDELLDVYRQRLAELEEMMQGRSAEARARLEAALAAKKGAVAEETERLAAIEATLAQRMAEEKQRLRQVGAAAVARQRHDRPFRHLVRSRLYDGPFGADSVADWLLAHAEELELSDQQEERIREAERAYRRAEIERDADIEVAELDLEELLRDEHSADLAAVEEQMRMIAGLRVEDRVARLRLRRQIHEVLTPEQQDKVEEMRPDRRHALLRFGDGPQVYGFRGEPGERFEFRLPELRERMERWGDGWHWFFRHDDEEPEDEDAEEGEDEMDGASHRGADDDTEGVVTL